MSNLRIAYAARSRAADLAFADDFFDVVVADSRRSGGLGERAGTRELARVLRPGGRLIIAAAGACAPSCAAASPARGSSSHSLPPMSAARFSSAWPAVQRRTRKALRASAARIAPLHAPPRRTPKLRSPASSRFARVTLSAPRGS